MSESDSYRNINDMYFVKSHKNDSESKNDVTAANEVEEEAVVEEQGPEIRLIKGTWSAKEEDLDFNTKCSAQIEAEYIKETKKRGITLDTFVIYNNEEEDLGQTEKVILNDEGRGQADLTLFYGEKYKQGTSENPDDNLCHYIFKVKGDNCINELDSEKLEMPFLPPCVEEKQKKKAEMNANGAHGGCTCTKDCATCEDQKECVRTDPCDFENDCVQRDSCKGNEST